MKKHKSKIIFLLLSIVSAAFLFPIFIVLMNSFKNKLYMSADCDLVKILLKVYKDHTGIDGKPVCIGGGTYAKSLPNILAFGPIFPSDEVREHKPDEFIEIPKLMKNAQIIASAMYEMAK